MSALASLVPPESRKRLIPLLAVLAAVILAGLVLVVLKPHHSSGTTSSVASTPAPATAATATTTPAPSAGTTSTPADTTDVPSATTKPTVVKHHHHQAAAIPDPFARDLQKAPSTSTASSGTQSSGSSSSSSSSTTISRTSSGTTTTSSTPSTTTTSTATPHTTPTTSTKAKTKSTAPKVVPGPQRVYASDVRLTLPTGATLRRDLPRLTALPSVSVPLAFYVGAVKARHRAAFLIPGGTTGTGSGVCSVPVEHQYRLLYLRAGQTEVLTSTDATGQTLRYQLGVVHLKATEPKNPHLARVANARMSTSGHHALYGLSLLHHTRIDSELGVLRSPKLTRSCG